MFSARTLLSLYALITVVAIVLFSGLGTEEAAPPPTYTPNKTYKITLLQTNDVQLEKYHSSNSLMMDERKKQIDAIKSQVEHKGGKTILLSGGDISASIEYAERSHLNDLNYTAMTVGLHQFDSSLEDIRKQQKRAHFPLLSANIFGSETGRPLFDAYKLVNIDGLTLAIIGVTEKYTPKPKNRKNLTGIDIIDPYEVVSELAPLLKRQADIVIVSTHLGHNPAKESRLSMQSLESIEGVDLVLGGHVYQASEKGQENHPDSCGRYLTQVDLEFRNGKLKIISDKQMATNKLFNDRQAVVQPLISKAN